MTQKYEGVQVGDVVWVRGGSLAEVVAQKDHDSEWVLAEYAGCKTSIHSSQLEVLYRATPETLSAFAKQSSTEFVQKLGADWLFLMDHSGRLHPIAYRKDFMMFALPEHSGEHSGDSRELSKFWDSAMLSGRAFPRSVAEWTNSQQAPNSHLKPGNTIKDPETGNRHTLVERFEIHGGAFWTLKDTNKVHVEGKEELWPAGAVGIIDFRIGDLVRVTERTTAPESIGQEAVVSHVEASGWAHIGIGNIFAPTSLELIYRPTREAWSAFSKPENIAWMAERERERPGCLFNWNTSQQFLAATTVNGGEFMVPALDQWIPNSVKWPAFIAEQTALPESVRRLREAERKRDGLLTMAEAAAGISNENFAPGAARRASANPGSIISGGDATPAGIPIVRAQHGDATCASRVCAFCGDPGNQHEPILEILAMHKSCSEQLSRKLAKQAIGALRKFFGKPDPYAEHRKTERDNNGFSGGRWSTEHSVDDALGRLYLKRIDVGFTADTPPPSKQKPVVHPWSADDREYES